MVEEGERRNRKERWSKEVLKPTLASRNIVPPKVKVIGGFKNTIIESQHSGISRRRKISYWKGFLVCIRVGRHMFPEYTRWDMK